MQTQDFNIHDLRLQIQVERTQRLNAIALLQKVKQELAMAVMERSKAESALQRNQRFIQQIADITPNILYIYDLIEQRNIYVNPAVTSVLGYSTEEIQQTGTALVKKLLHPDDIEQAHKHFQQWAGLKDNEISEFEFRLRDSKGEWLWFRSRNTVFSRTPDGRPQKIFGTAGDITLAKQIKESQRGLTEILLEAKLAISQASAQEEFTRFKLITSRVANELRMSLTTILGSAQILEQLKPYLEKPQVIGNIKEVVQDMNKLLEDILLISDFEAEKLEPHPKGFNITRFIRAIVAELELSTGRRDTIIISSQEPVNKVQLDKKLLRRIFSNLLDNAMKYSPIGNEIWVNFSCSESQAVFQIQDQGIGISPKDIPHVFEWLYRGSNVGLIPGTGVGLAIVKQCVDLHGGEITVDSVVGRGTTFTVTLPQKKFL